MHTRKDVEAVLIKKIKACHVCEYYKNGRAYPWFGKTAKYLIVGEAPHIDEIKEGTFFVGRSGKYMWDHFTDLIGLSREDFIILNSVLCKPTIPEGKTIGKPTKDIINNCFIKRTNILTYLYDSFNIRHIFCVGNYSRYLFTDEMDGISRECGNTESYKIQDRDFIVTYSVHPSSCFHNPANKDKFIKAIKSFGEVITFGYDGTSSI
jgi:uracil-DNA glycosylase family 4